MTRAQQVRLETLRLIHHHKATHYGGSLSVVDILVALEEQVDWSKNLLVFGKGHACWPLHVMGMRNDTPGSFEPEKGPFHSLTTSLGNALPIAVGMAMARKIKGEPGTVYCIIGDGEMQEGTTWECMWTAVRNKLDNLCLIVDQNGVQGSDPVADVLPMCGIETVFDAAHWIVIPNAGRDWLPMSGNWPTVLFWPTVKGHGVSFMENKPCGHSMWLDDEKFATAEKELSL